MVLPYLRDGCLSSVEILSTPEITNISIHETREGDGTNAARIDGLNPNLRLDAITLDIFELRASNLSLEREDIEGEFLRTVIDGENLSFRARVSTNTESTRNHDAIRESHCFVLSVLWFEVISLQIRCQQFWIYSFLILLREPIAEFFLVFYCGFVTVTAVHTPAAFLAFPRTIIAVFSDFCKLNVFDGVADNPDNDDGTDDDAYHF